MAPAINLENFLFVNPSFNSSLYTLTEIYIILSLFIVSMIFNFDY